MAERNECPNVEECGPAESSFESQTEREVAPEAAEVSHHNVQVEDIPNVGVMRGVETVPPWYVCLSVGLQHYLLMFGPTISIPFILVHFMCIETRLTVVNEMVCSIFFGCGLVTLLQTSVGIRLGLVHGVAFAHIVPAMSILNLDEWKCTAEDYLPPCTSSYNIVAVTNCTNNTEKWKSRILEIQGAVMIASTFEILCGLTGFVGLLTRVVGPMTLAPTVALLGLSLFQPAAMYASQQWWIALLTTVLIMLFSLILRSVTVPCCTYKSGHGCIRFNYPLFQMFPVVLAVIIVWVLCAVFTVTNVFPATEGEWGYEARTDSRLQILYEAPWIHLPYPGKWGMPTASLSSVMGMLAGVLAAIVNSVGNFYSCARLSELPPPPSHAINRGIVVSGIGNVVASSLAVGVGTLSSSQNIAVIGMTQIASRRVFMTAGAITLVLALFGKFGAIFVTIPAPIIGGFFFAFSGLITAVGVSNLQNVNMNSSRNLFIFGFSIFFGLSLPNWLSQHEDSIKTGLPALDNVLRVLGTTMMFVGGLSGLILDNLVPGTKEERGLISAKEASTDMERLSSYDLPLAMNFLYRQRWTRYIPVCPSFDEFWCKKGKNKEVHDVESAKSSRKSSIALDNTKSHGRRSIEKSGEAIDPQPPCGAPPIDHELRSTEEMCGVAHESSV